MEYFPRAIDIAKGLRTGGYVDTFIYTTHAWLVSLYLDCPPNLAFADGIQLQVSVLEYLRLMCSFISVNYVSGTLLA